MLIDIVRILGVANRYLAAGGVKDDSHFPWHSLSNLSKIRQELDIWAAGTQDTFASIETLFWTSRQHYASSEQVDLPPDSLPSISTISTHRFGGATGHWSASIMANRSYQPVLLARERDC